MIKDASNEKKLVFHFTELSVRPLADNLYLKLRFFAVGFLHSFLLQFYKR
jgi:hypothetical protein